MTKTNKIVRVLVTIIIATILIMIVAMKSNAQEIKQVASWSNSKTTKLGNGNIRWEMTMARSWRAEKVYDINGNIISINLISGIDTVSYIYSNFSEYVGEERDGNYFDMVRVSKGKTATLTIMKGNIEVKNDTIITNKIIARKDTVKKHIQISFKGRDMMKVVNLKGINDKGEFVDIEKIEKIGNKIIFTSKDTIDYFDPT
jgi:hypothetical protein